MTATAASVIWLGGIMVNLADVAILAGLVATVLDAAAMMVVRLGLVSRGISSIALVDVFAGNLASSVLGFIATARGRPSALQNASADAASGLEVGGVLIKSLGQVGAAS